MASRYGSRALDWSRWLLSDSRAKAIVAGLLVGIGIEALTSFPGILLLIVVVPVAAPVVCFVLFWRGFILFRQYDLLASRHKSDWVGRDTLWVAFWLLWAADVLAATIFVLHPDLYEVNPVTVAMFEMLGAVGVVLAGLCYAMIVVLPVSRLPKPHDVDVLSGAVLVYALLALANYVLLFRTGVHDWIL